MIHPLIIFTDYKIPQLIYPIAVKALVCRQERPAWLQALFEALKKMCSESIWSGQNLDISLDEIIYIDPCTLMKELKGGTMRN